MLKQVQSDNFLLTFIFENRFNGFNYWFYNIIMKNKKNITAFIKNHSALFWYIKKSKQTKISLNLLIETILNYGTLDDVRELFKLLGFKNVADIFFKTIKNNYRCNYLPPVKNFFTLFFKKYA